MTVRQFLSIRRTKRLTRKAHKAMFRVYGAAWSLNAAGVVEMLTAPGQVIVLEGAMLEQVIRQTVNVALNSASSGEQEFDIQAEEPAFSEVADTAALPPAEESPALTSSIFEERREVSNGAPPAQPVQPVPAATSADEKRREFIRSFLRDDRAARGLGIPTR